MNLIANIFVTFFYLGKFPIAPGTMGSIAAISIWCLLVRSNFQFLLVFFIAFLLLSYLFTNIYLKKENKDDPSEVICDEIVGQLIPLFIINTNNDIYLILIAFVSFRIFDIFKLYPANLAERMHGAIGVILDDIIAGIYSLIVVFIFKYLLIL